MARNGSGTYSKVNTFVAGNTITASGHNQNWDDLVSEMTNSIAADGQTSMTGPLKLAAGSVGAPGMVFSSDTDTGIYRIGANNIGIAVGGAKALDISATACNAIGIVQQNGFAVTPVGSITMYAGSSAPSGWLLCYGQDVSRTTYADLFAAISTSYGTGDGSTTFGLPDLRGRIAAGKDDMGGSAASRLTSTTITSGATTLGNVGGEQTHALIAGEIPTLTSTGNFASSQTSIVNASADTTLFSANAGSQVWAAWAQATTIQRVQITGSLSVSTSGTSGTAHNNVQPTIILNYIIFAGA